jgi:hypothetical protein
VDNLNSQVHKFTPDLRLVTSQGRFGTKDYEFENPAGITIYKHYGQVFVSDKESAQYFWIGSDVKDFKAAKTGDNKIRFDFVLTEKSFATIVIEGAADADGKPNRVQVVNKAALEMGKNSVSWEIPPELSKTVLKPGATYTVSIRLTATYSSYPHIEKFVKTLLFL